MPEVLTYSLESTIVEKFDVLLQRLELTSRMKDIYDIYYLSSMYCPAFGRLFAEICPLAYGVMKFYKKCHSILR